jgi:hypothetical protein
MIARRIELPPSSFTEFGTTYGGMKFRTISQPRRRCRYVTLLARLLPAADTPCRA